MVVVTVSVLENVQIVSSTVQISCKLALAVLNTTLATSLDVSKEKILEKDHQIEALEARLSDLNPPPTLSPSPQMSLPPEKLPPGVSRHRTKYRARRKGQYLGVFDTIDKAQAAYEARRCLRNQWEWWYSPRYATELRGTGWERSRSIGNISRIIGNKRDHTGHIGTEWERRGHGRELPGSR